MTADELVKRRGRPRAWERWLAPALKRPGEWVQVRTFATAGEAGAAVRRLRGGGHPLPEGSWLFKRVEASVCARWAAAPGAPRQRKPPPPVEPEEPPRARVVVDRDTLGRPREWAEVAPDAAVPEHWDERLWHEHGVGR